MIRCIALQMKKCMKIRENERQNAGEKKDNLTKFTIKRSMKEI